MFPQNNSSPSIPNKAEKIYKFSSSCEERLSQAISYLSQATPPLDTAANIAEIKQHIIIEKGHIKDSTVYSTRDLDDFLYVLEVLLKKNPKLLTQSNLDLLLKNIDHIFEIYSGFTCLENIFDGITQTNFGLLIRHAPYAGATGEAMGILLKANLPQYIEPVLNSRPQWAVKVAPGIRALSEAEPRLDTPDNIALLIEQAPFADSIAHCLLHLRTLTNERHDTQANFIELIQIAEHAEKIQSALYDLLYSANFYGISKDDLQLVFTLCIAYAPRATSSDDLVYKVKEGYSAFYRARNADISTGKEQTISAPNEFNDTSKKPGLFMNKKTPLDSSKSDTLELIDKLSSFF